MSVECDGVFRVVNKPVRMKMRGKTVDLMREQYLRTDISCGSKHCLACSKSNIDFGDNKSCLPDGTSHYLIPFPDIAIKYLEILEFPEILGIIFPQTVIQQVLHIANKKIYTRICGIVRDVRKRSVFFANEICQQTYFPRKNGESLASYCIRVIYSTAVWYYSHLDGRVPIVLITEDAEIIKRFENQTNGVLLYSLGSYLKRFFPNLETAYNIYEVLSSLLSMGEVNESFTEYKEHLSLDVLEVGIKSGRYYQGILHVNKHHAKMEAFVSFQSANRTVELASDILISGVRHRNRAIHGDLVVVEMLPKAEWRGRILSLKKHEDVVEISGTCSDCISEEILPTAKVVGILQRNWRDYIVTFPLDENFCRSGAQENVLTIPYDNRIPKIRLLTRQASDLEGQRLVVRIDSWNVNSQYPNGHFIRSLGKIGDIETETLTILVENEVSCDPFPPSVLREMPADTSDDSFVMDTSAVSVRRDLRLANLILSIDPKGCVDVDDALSIRRLENGHLELGVHIADVTHFVYPNTCTDIYARSRGTTVYLADRCYHMLPSILSSNLCSLTSKVDRFAVSVMWILDEDYQVVDIWCGRTIINSSYKLSYEVAQEIIDGKAIEQLSNNIPELENLSLMEVNERFCELRSVMLLLMEVARVLKARRLLAGALELESTEIQIEFRDAEQGGSMDSITPKLDLEIHSTVAECMIMANHWVAKRIKDKFPTRALLRRHPHPRQDQFGILLSLAKAKGFNVDTSSNRSLAVSLDKCIDPRNQYVNKIVRIATVQAMNLAVYCSTGTLPHEDLYHYGLALGEYTHFTSPIRRYADIIVHRLLLATTEHQNRNLLSCSALQEVCNHINVKHKAAQNAQRESQKLFQCIFFGSLSEDDERRNTLGIVFAIRANGLLAYLPRYGFKGPLFLRNRQQQVAYMIKNKVEWTAGNLQEEEFSITVSTSFGKQSYHVFDSIMVHIGVEHSYAHASSIKLDLLNNRVPLGYNNSMLEKIISRQEMIKDATNFQNKAFELENNATEIHGDEIGTSSIGSSTSEVSEFYLLLEDLRKVALHKKL